MLQKCNYGVFTAIIGVFLVEIIHHNCVMGYRSILRFSHTTCPNSKPYTIYWLVLLLILMLVDKEWRKSQEIFFTPLIMEA